MSSSDEEPASKRRRGVVNKETYKSNVIRNAMVPINVKKIKDLQALKPYLVGYQEFYETIFQWPTTEAECTIDRVYDEE